MPRKYIRLCLSASELNCIIQAKIKLNPIAHQAISNWETINPEQQKQLMRDRQILYINEPPIIKIIGADRILLEWLATCAISNESLTLSTAIGLVLVESAQLFLPSMQPTQASVAQEEPPLVVPSELADRLRSIGGDPLNHLKIAVEKYLINCCFNP